jgi:hypothetical protein
MSDDKKFRYIGIALAAIEENNDRYGSTPRTQVYGEEKLILPENMSEKDIRFAVDSAVRRMRAVLQRFPDDSIKKIEDGS